MSPRPGGDGRRLRLPRPEKGPVHPEQERSLRLALLGVALDHAAGIADALEARAARLLHHLADLVEAAVHVAAFDFHRCLQLLLAEPRGWSGRGGGCRSCYADIFDCHVNRAFVSRAAEAADGRLVTLRDGRRTRLLQADDVATEAEAEIARVRPWDLFG